MNILKDKVPSSSSFLTPTPQCSQCHEQIPREKFSASILTGTPANVYIRDFMSGFSRVGKKVGNKLILCRRVVMYLQICDKHTLAIKNVSIMCALTGYFLALHDSWNSWLFLSQRMRSSSRFLAYKCFISLFHKRFRFVWRSYNKGIKT